VCKCDPYADRPAVYNPAVTTPVVEIEKLSRRFGTFTAVDSLTLVANAGEVFGLLGSNGAGKSTTIKMLIFAKLYDIPRSEQQARIREQLTFVDLSADAGRLVSQYSGGMVRRLEIAQATLHRPRVLFLDEPTVGLDPIARDAVWKHLIDLRDQYGTTLFLTTHYLEDAETHCDRIAIMHMGKLAALGTLKELEASLGTGSHTLDEVFVHYAGATLDSGGNFRAVSAERTTEQRLG
jgi:ABC-2 type transport system ATP-binding protein